MKQNKGKNDRSAEIGPRLRHRRDFKVPVPQVKFDRARSKPGEIEAAEVAALVGGKDEPIRQSIRAYRGRGSRPVINRQRVAAWSKTGEIKVPPGARPKIQMRTGGAQDECADAGRAPAALAEISFCESP